MKPKVRHAKFCLLSLLLLIFFLTGILYGQKINTSEDEPETMKVELSGHVDFFYIFRSKELTSIRGEPTPTGIGEYSPVGELHLRLDVDLTDTVSSEVRLLPSWVSPSKSVSCEITGTGTTTGLVFKLTNNTDKRAGVIVPTGTLLTTTSEGFQPYQTGYVPPIFLGPGETVTTEVPAFCADNDLEPAPADGSVKYTVQAGPASHRTEKVTELIVIANAMQTLHTTCGEVAEPDDFIGLMSTAFVEDRTFAAEVWNQPLRSYRIQKEPKVSVELQERSQIKYAHNDIGMVTGYTEVTYDDSGKIILRRA